MTQPKTTAAKTPRTVAKAPPVKAAAKDDGSARTKVMASASKKGDAVTTPLRQPTAAKSVQVASQAASVQPAAEPAVAAAVPAKTATVVAAPVKASTGASKSQPTSAPAKVPAKASGHRNGFRTGEFVVYPAHGVGQIVAIEEQEVAGFKLELFVVSFMKDKMTLRVPTSKVASVGLRKLADTDVMQRALDTLMGRARIKRTMWSRRAQEYEAKINSGDIVAIAEVVRDLYRSDAQPEQSYSERQLYEAALDRMAREIAAVQKLTESESLKLVDSQLQRGPRRGPKTDGDADATDGEADADIEEAA